MERVSSTDKIGAHLNRIEVRRLYIIGNMRIRFEFGTRRSDHSLEGFVPETNDPVSLVNQTAQERHHGLCVPHGGRREDDDRGARTHVVSVHLTLATCLITVPLVGSSC